MKKRILYGFMAALLAFSVVPAQAEQANTATANAIPTQPANLTSSYVCDHAIALLNGILSPEQITTLNLLAHQVAVANACKGFEVDDKKFVDQFQTLTLDKDAKASAEQKDKHDKHLSVVYGVLVGGELASIANDEASACDAAQKEKENPEFKDVSVWK